MLLCFSIQSNLFVYNCTKSRGFICSHVLVDSWFAVAPFLDALNRGKNRYVCEVNAAILYPLFLQH